MTAPGAPRDVRGRLDPPGRTGRWAGSLREVERWQWWIRDGGRPGERLATFLGEHARDGGAVVLLAGADGCAALAGLPAGAASPVPAVPDLVAVAVRPADERREAAPSGGGATAGTTALGVSAGRLPLPAAPPRRVLVPAGAWRTTWTDAEHADAVEQVRGRIARGDVYQANVVGHRWAGHRCDPLDLASAVAALPGATYGGVLAGDGWAVGCASPEQLVRVRGRRVTTEPVKGTAPVRPGSARRLRANPKERAEHVMIVDLERNDLSRVARTGSVAVERLYDLTRWNGLWHAGSRVAAELRDDVGPVELLAALAPGGSVTGAPKRAACSILAGLEPVGRGPSMGAFGLIWEGGLDLGLTIRTVAADVDSVHLWAGGGVTWSSDPAAEVAEAHAKAGPVVRALAGQVRPSTS